MTQQSVRTDHNTDTTPAEVPLKGGSIISTHSLDNKGGELPRGALSRAGQFSVILRMQVGKTVTGDIHYTCAPEKKSMKSPGPKIITRSLLALL